MDSPEPLPALYQELAGWWPLLSSPADYAEEAQWYEQALRSACACVPRTLLELGSGGGNNACYLKASFRMTLVDLSPAMLAVSRSLNPECEHLEGDMRSVGMGRLFDAVFVHDAIAYMRSESDLARAIATAHAHCRHGGAALFAPDFTRETFRPATSHGGHDGEGRSLRYLEWIWDPDPDDTTYVADMAYVLREGLGEPRCVLDRHVLGLFSQAQWLDLIARAGFEARVLPFDHSELDPGSAHVFLGIKPAAA